MAIFDFHSAVFYCTHYPVFTVGDIRASNQMGLGLDINIGISSSVLHGYLWRDCGHGDAG